MHTAKILSLDDYLPSEDNEDSRKREFTNNTAAPNPGRVAETRERQGLLVKAILELPEQQQKVLNLYYYEELTLKEVGAVLDVSELRVSQIHSAAMKKLRKLMQEHN